MSAVRFGLATVSGPAVLLAIAHDVLRPGPLRACFGSKQEVAQSMVWDLAERAFPEWAAANPGRARPSSLDELLPFVNTRRPIDPWGMPVAMQPSARGIRVVSAGPDRWLCTADDISWSTP
jgi:hypothetical protein